MFAVNGRIVATAALVFIFCAAVSSASAQQPASSPAVQPSNSRQDSSVQPALTPGERQAEHARILMASKRYEDAIGEFQELLKTEPKNATYLNMVGIAYLNLSNFDQAKKYFERSAKADKKFASAVNNLGMVWYQRKNYRRAIREYEKAARIDPGLAGVYANLGFAYYNTKKYPEAIAEFHKAFEIDPHALEHNDRAGSMVQDRSVSNHGYFFFLIAREYAQSGDAVTCAQYLRKSFDEGYSDIKNAKTDPAFARVLNDPAIQDVLMLLTPGEQKADGTSPGA